MKHVASVGVEQDCGKAWPGQKSEGGRASPGGERNRFSRLFPTLFPFAFLFDLGLAVAPLLHTDRKKNSCYTDY